MENKKRYKVLNDDMKTPFQNFYMKLGEKYHCSYFSDSENDCDLGFYATGIEGLLYSLRCGRRVFECNVWGKEKEFNQFKMRYENIELIREIEIGELDKLILHETEKLDYNLYRAIYPIDPRDIDYKLITENDIENLEKWDSVRDSMGDSVWDSVRDSMWGSVRGYVRDSVWDSVRGSVWDSVSGSVRDYMWDYMWDSVRDSVWAYISSLFPKIKKWEYIDHKEGENPFQCCIDLWHRGLVPSFDGETWRLHGGKKIEIVYELKKNK